MGAQKLRRKIVQHERETEKLMRVRLASVAVIQDSVTGMILSIGVDHSSAFLGLPAGTPEGSWEVKEFRLWR